MVEKINSSVRKDYNLSGTNFIVEILPTNCWVIYEIPSYGLVWQLRIRDVILDLWG
jgi:hypothetical protein